MVKAAHRYDPDRGYTFHKYCDWFVRRGCMRVVGHMRGLEMADLPEKPEASVWGSAPIGLLSELAAEPEPGKPGSSGHRLGLSESRMLDFERAEVEGRSRY